MPSCAKYSPPGFGFAYDPEHYPGRGEGKDALTLAQLNISGSVSLAFVPKTRGKKR